MSTASDDPTGPVPSLDWTVPGSHPVLSATEVHVWRVTLDTDPLPYSGFLSEDERARAARFRFDRDRDHYTVARGVLRRLLGRYLEVRPSDLAFTYGEHEKPALAVPAGVDLRFNLSHSHGLALIAVSRGREVGVDIEYVQREVGDEGIARRFFSAAEVEVLMSLPEPDRRAAFFRCWTRKEAYLKGRGDGIYYGLHHFAVSITAEAPAALLANELHPEEVDRWSFRALIPGPGYEGAVAAEGQAWELRCWQTSHGSG
jgi:4'-phosphopantetheinyl transferase